jgi:YCII-related domain
MTDLPRERQPDPALEGRVVSTLVAAGLVRRRRAWPVWVAAAAAVVVLAIGVSVFRPKHTLAPGNTYVILLYEDSAYRPAPKGHGAERVAEVARWADSLDAVGKLERAGRLVGPGPVGGLFIIRAAGDSDVARIAAACPFTKWGGRVEVKRFEE